MNRKELSKNRNKSADASMSAGINTEACTSTGIGAGVSRSSSVNTGGDTSPRPGAARGRSADKSPAGADRLLGAAGLLMGISILSRLAGFVREQAIAAQFGTSLFTDAYVVAYTIVNVVYLILGGALATVFIPVFISYLHSHEGKAAGTTAGVLNDPPADAVSPGTLLASERGENSGKQVAGSCKGSAAAAGASPPAISSAHTSSSAVSSPAACSSAAYPPAAWPTAVAHRSAWELASTVINFTLLAMGFLAVLGIAASPWLVKLIAPGFSSEAASLTSRLTQIMFPIALLAALSMLAGGILNSLQHFAWPALSSVVFSLTVAAAVFTLGAIWGIEGLAAGTVIATLLQVGVQVPALKRHGMRYFLRLRWNHPGMREIGHLVGPVLLGNTVSQAYVAVERILASGLATGSIAALNFASKLMLLPFNLFAMAINTAIFPTLADHAASGDREALGRTTALGIKLVGILLIPAAAGMMALAEPLVRLAYERGAFNTLSTRMTSTALYCYLLGLFALGAFNVLHRAFYALKDTRTPVAINILAVLANAGLGLLLVRPLQHAGLALAVALAANLNLVFAYICLQRRLPGLSPRTLFPPLGKILLAALFMGAAVWVTQKGLGWLLGFRLNGGMALSGSLGPNGGIGASWDGWLGANWDAIATNPETTAAAQLSLWKQVLQVGISTAVGVIVYLLGIKKLNADAETVALIESWLKKKLGGKTSRKQETNI